MWSQTYEKRETDEYQLLTNAVIDHGFDGWYVGRIERVALVRSRNPFNPTEAKLQPCVFFADGFRWVPNTTARKQLEARYVNGDAMVGEWFALETFDQFWDKPHRDYSQRQKRLLCLGANPTEKEKSKPAEPVFDYVSDPQLAEIARVRRDYVDPELEHEIERAVRAAEEIPGQKE